jgi:hypothetical protein
LSFDKTISIMIQNKIQNILEQRWSDIKIIDIGQW